MEAVLKQANVKRIEKMGKGITETARRKEYESKVRHGTGERSRCFGKLGVSLKVFIILTGRVNRLLTTCLTPLY